MNSLGAAWESVLGRASQGVQAGYLPHATEAEDWLPPRISTVSSDFPNRLIPLS